ncbi:hypothetical protein DOTSEDRAFT_71383 [Dothistroma septosporum NZE10]|uniref:Uncharacterized protein n=1 Tax=Dothistroma septosporum (strain NZE10 / CBS 128990) TaxID=675120 RepID=N1PTC9_DOTSN|nr:hypothetical protein DOTSEDRAFT_71383 [Dothistroma septosporum NZE10]
MRPTSQPSMLGPGLAKQTRNRLWFRKSGTGYLPPDSVCFARAGQLCAFGAVHAHTSAAVAQQ